MKKSLIGVLSLLTIGLSMHIERINPHNPSDLVTISAAEARRGGGGRGGGGRGGGRGGRHGGGRSAPRGGNRSAHKSVDIDVDVHHHGRRGRGGAFVAGAIVGAAVVALGTRHTYLPSGCTSYDYSGRPYYHCGAVYYQPVYDGPTVVYVVVDNPS